MLAVVTTEYGGFETLAVIDVEPPPMTPDSVRVRVRAAGVNPVDNAVRAGYMQPYLPAKPPVVLGFDVAGVVEAVGDAVTDFRAGDAVAGHLLSEALRVGAFAETVVAHADAFVRMPDGMDFRQAAAVPHAGLTASQAIHDVLRVQAGEVVLVHAAAGGVGSIAVQLARRVGARVLGTSLEHNADYLRSLGAEPIRYDIDIAEQVRVLAPDGVDAVLDLIGGAEVEGSLSVLRDSGRLASTVDLGIARLGGQLVAGHPDRDQLAMLISDVAAGELTIHIADVFSLTEAPAALKLLAEGHVRGKLVIGIDPTPA